MRHPGPLTSTEEIEVAVIGAGQAGLSMSYYLKLKDVEHVVLEQANVADTWRNKRWDSFTLVTPNWRVGLPGFPYRGSEPDGFMTRDEVVALLEDFAHSFQAPVRTGIHVRALERGGDLGYLIRTDHETIASGAVVVATGAFQSPKIPPCARMLPGNVVQRAAEEYRNPGALPAGAVLIVGSGQSGTQIAEELVESGRKVYLATSGAGRVPRRYRGKDILFWSAEIGMDDDRADEIIHRGARTAAAPHVTGKNGGHDITLQGLEDQGVILLGSLESADGGRLRFLPNLQEHFVKEEEFARQMLARIDRYILAHGKEVPVEPEGRTTSRSPVRAQTAVTDLDMRSAGISTVIWATGYRPAFDWIHIPIFDETGYPIQERGVTSCPGLYFLGLHWMHTRISGALPGVARDAEYVASHIASAVRARSE